MGDKRHKMRALLIVAAVAAAVGGYVGIKGILGPQKGGEITTISESALEKVIEISELSTVAYTYNAVAAAYAEDGTTLKYHVAYEGTVKAGINFEKIDIHVDEEQKQIRITIPEVEIQDYVIDPGKLDYIFEKNKYDEASVSSEAYKISLADLQKRAGEEEELLKLARENAIAAVEGLISPWVKQIDSEYTIEIR